jgi:hypothetical protein
MPRLATLVVTSLVVISLVVTSQVVASRVEVPSILTSRLTRMSGR